MKITPYEIHLAKNFDRVKISRYGCEVKKENNLLSLYNRHKLIGKFSTIFIYETFNIIIGKSKNFCALTYGPKVFSNYKISDINTTIFIDRNNIFVGVTKYTRGTTGFNILNLANMSYIYNGNDWPSFSEIVELSNQVIILKNKFNSYTLVKRNSFGSKSGLSNILAYQCLADGTYIVKMYNSSVYRYIKVYGDGSISNEFISSFVKDVAIHELSGNANRSIAQRKEETVSKKKDFICNEEDNDSIVVIKIKDNKLRTRVKSQKELKALPYEDGKKAESYSTQNTSARNIDCFPKKTETSDYETQQYVTLKATIEKNNINSRENFINNLKTLTLSALNITPRERVIDALDTIIHGRFYYLQGYSSTLDAEIENNSKSITLRDLVDDAFLDEVARQLRTCEDISVFSQCREYMSRLISDRYQLLQEIIKDKQIGNQVKEICNELLLQRRKNLGFTQNEIRRTINIFIDETIAESISQRYNAIQNNGINNKDTKCDISEENGINQESNDFIVKHIFDKNLKCKLNDKFPISSVPYYQSVFMSNEETCVLFCNVTDIQDSLSTGYGAKCYNLQLTKGFESAKKSIDDKYSNKTWILLAVNDNETYIMFYDIISVIAYVSETQTILMKSKLRFSDRSI